jgi:5-aminopentanamidase
VSPISCPRQGCLAGTRPPRKPVNCIPVLPQSAPSASLVGSSEKVLPARFEQHETCDMSPQLRVALAAAPFPRSIEHGLNWVDQLTRRAAEAGAQVVCFPESYIPGMRGIDEPVLTPTQAVLDRALEHVRTLAQSCGLALILPMERHCDTGIQAVAWVISERGELLGNQEKTQLDPAEDDLFVPGVGRRLFEVSGVKIGISICHEGFRYPETVRWAAREGAAIVFHPHCTGSNYVGERPTSWRAANSRYYEHAITCRALENEIYCASVNYACAFPESATCIISPNGECLGYQPYGELGVLVRDIDVDAATRRLALRFRPERCRASQD